MATKSFTTEYEFKDEDIPKLLAAMEDDPREARKSIEIKVFRSPRVFHKLINQVRNRHFRQP